MNEFVPRLAWSEFVYDLQKLLRQNEINTPLYIVGGSVRDAYRRAEITDIDIAVNGDALKIARQVADWLDADIYIMDRERGVARVFINTVDGALLIDFARFRGPTLEDDLRDRDFTINAMAADLGGDLTRLIDPLGGLRDLRGKVLRICAEGAIAADPIRALRAVRQSTQLGLRIHPDSLVAIRPGAEGLALSSRERVRDEFFKLLGLEKASRGLRVLQHLGLLCKIIPDFQPFITGLVPAQQGNDTQSNMFTVVERMTAILTSIGERRTDNTAAAFDLGMLVVQLDRFRPQLRQHINRSYGNARNHQQLLVLAALLKNPSSSAASDGQARKPRQIARTVSRSLRLSLDEEKRLISMLGSTPDLRGRRPWSDLELHRFWFRLGENGIDALLLAVAGEMAKHGAKLDQSAWLRIVENVTISLDTYYNHRERVVNPDLFLKGNDVMDLLAIDEGPVVGKLLMALREAQVLGDVTSIDAARGFVKRRYAELR